STITMWQHYIDRGFLPTLTWVPAVIILFPLILHGPPARMLAAAVAAAAMSPLALLMRDLFGKVRADLDAYAHATVSATFAVGFAYMGAGVVYGLGRGVAAAR